MSSPLKQNTTTIQNLLDMINSLPDAGTDLPELTNEGNADDLMLGKQLIDSEGNEVTGTFSLNTELSEQDALISIIRDAVNSLPAAGGGGGSSEPNLQDKTVTPTTSTQTITADSSYDGLSKVTVNAIPSTYVKPAATKAATTYTPTTSNQTIAAGTYCSGTQTIKGDANLIPENIVSGKTIFGVAGTAESGGGSGSGSIETCTGSITFDGPPEAVIIYYINSSMQLSHFTSDSEMTFNPVKNSIIHISGWNAMSSCSGNAELVGYGMGEGSYFISGNFTLIYGA